MARRRDIFPQPQRTDQPGNGELVEALWELVIATRGSSAADEPTVRRASEAAVRLLERCRPPHVAI